MQDITDTANLKQTETVNSLRSFGPRNLQPDCQNFSETCEIAGEIVNTVYTQVFRAKCKKTVLFELFSYLLNSFRAISSRFVAHDAPRPRRANRIYGGKK
jgi:hypothetical protein